MKEFLLTWTLAVVWASGSVLMGQNLLLKQGQFIDPELKKVTTGNLLIESGMVSGFVNDAPPQFEGTILELDGKYVLPGFIDMHTHSYGNMGPNFTVMDMTMTPGVAYRMLYAGVTAFLDLFSAEQYILPLRDQQRAGAWTGASLFASGPILTATGGHGTEYGIPTRTINTPEEAVAVIDSLAKSRPDVVKIVYDTQGNMPTIDKMTLEAAIETAKSHSLRVVVHIGTWKDVEDALDAGANAVTHTPSGMPPEGLPERMASSKMAIIPTLSVQTELSTIVQNAQLLDDPLLSDLAPIPFRDAYRDTSTYSPRMKGFIIWQERFGKDLFLAIGTLSRAGVTIFTGTDAGNPGVFQGYSVHREMELLSKSGLSNWEILSSSTTHPSNFLEINHGLQPGNKADLVVLNKSPLESIRNTRTIEYVIQNGKMIDRIPPVKNSP